MTYLFKAKTWTKKLYNIKYLKCDYKYKNKSVFMVNSFGDSNSYQESFIVKQMCCQEHQHVEKIENNVKAISALIQKIKDVSSKETGAFQVCQDPELDTLLQKNGLGPVLTAASGKEGAVFAWTIVALLDTLRAVASLEASQLRSQMTYCNTCR